MKLLKLKLFVFALIVFAAGSAFASYSYEVTVNTASLGLTGDSGYLYLQYDPSNSAVSSTATITNFYTDGTLGAIAPGVATGQSPATLNSNYYVSGTLPSQVTFGNTNGTNDYNQVMTFGTGISFEVTLSNATNNLSSTGSSTFSLALSPSVDGSSYYSFGDPGNPGTLAYVSINDDGTAGSPLTYTGATAQATPIPPTALLFGTGLIGLIGIRRRAKN